VVNSGGRGAFEASHSAQQIRFTACSMRVRTPSS
jgi:hypothetical protein